MLISGGSYVEDCGAAVLTIFMLYFKSADCFTLIFSFACTRSVENVASLHKTFCTKLNVRRLFLLRGKHLNDENLEL